MDFENARAYRKELTLEDLQAISEGMIISKGKGMYPELDKDEEIHWIAIKGYGYDDWAIYYGSSKQRHEYWMHNGEKVQGDSMIKELTNCTDEVLSLYRR